MKKFLIYLYSILLIFLGISCKTNDVATTLSNNVIPKEKIVHKEIPYYGYMDFGRGIASQKEMKEYKESMYISEDAPDFLISDYKEGVCINYYAGYYDRPFNQGIKRIKIPETIDGKPVIKIGEKIELISKSKLDESSNSWKNEHLYESGNWLIHDINWLHFKMDPYPVATDIVIPKHVREISNRSTSWLCENIIVDKDNPYYSSQDGLLYNKDKTILIDVPQYYKITDIEIPEGTEQIFDDFMRVADYGNNEYTDIEFSRKHYNLKIPSTVTKFCEKKGLKETPVFKKIEVHEDNQNFSSDEGVLFDKNKTILLHYPVFKKGRYYMLPNSVKKVSKWAFDEFDLQYLYAVKGERYIDSIPEWVNQTGEWNLK